MDAQRGHSGRFYQPLVEFPHEGKLRLVVFLSYILYCFYIGVLLVFLPWTPLWDANGIVARLPSIQPVMLSGLVRGS